jgi:hypothetical protein
MIAGVNFDPRRPTLAQLPKLMRRLCKLLVSEQGERLT